MDSEEVESLPAELEGWARSGHRAAEVASEAWRWAPGTRLTSVAPISIHSGVAILSSQVTLAPRGRRLEVEEVVAACSSVRTTRFSGRGSATTVE